MGYKRTKGPSLSEFAHRAADEASDASRQIASQVGDRMTSHIQRNTPVDQNILRPSIRKSPVLHRVYGTARGWVSGTHTEVDYAPHVEHGTGLWGPQHRKYLILPKKPGGTLRWVDKLTGELRFAKRVMHPGSPGAHMFSRGVAETEVEVPRIADVILHNMARRVERI